MTTATPRYTGVAMALHWATALSVLLLLASGQIMTNLAPGVVAFSLYQAHKSLGLTVLVLTGLRVVWRLTHAAPPLPDTMKPQERLAAKGGHLAFYVLLIGLPLLGWAMVSTSALSIPTIWFGLFEVPHFPGPDTLEARKAASELFRKAHAIGGWMMLALLVLHVGAALRHALALKDGVMDRMIPSRRQATQGVVVIGSLIAAVTAAALLRPHPSSIPATQPVADAPRGETDATGTALTGPGWIVDKAASTLTFRGTQLGSAFDGRFTRFNAAITFDPANPGEARADVTVDTASATTEDAQRDGALPQDTWFAVAKFPTARFVADGFRDLGDGRYEAAGNLTLRGVTLPVTLPFTLTIEGDVARAKGEVVLIRTDYGLGATEYPDGSMVGLDVTVTIDLTAQKEP